MVHIIFSDELSFCLSINLNIMKISPSVCMICDESALSWIPHLKDEWSINYLFCKNKELKQMIVTSFNLQHVETNETDDVFDFIHNLDETKVDVLFLALFTNTFHEEILEYTLKKRKIFFLFSCNLPTYDFEKLNHFRNLTNNFNLYSDIVYDVKTEYKESNKQFYYYIYNTLLSERVFSNLQEMLAELGHIYGMNIECTFIPFLLDEEEGEEEIDDKSVSQEDTLREKEMVLFHRAILIASLIKFLCSKPKSVFAKSYLMQKKQTLPYLSEKEIYSVGRTPKQIVKCLSGYVALNNMHCNFNITVNAPTKLFNIEVYGENGFITLSYNKEHNCFQIQRCLNNYEYPHLYEENSQQNSLNELKYFIQEKYFTNKYLNSYIDSIYITSCIWNSNGLNISLNDLQTEIENTNVESNTQSNYIIA